MKKTKVYWCHTFSDTNPNQLMGFEPEPLAKVLRKDLDSLDNKDLFKCESLMSDTKNAFVCRTSYDLIVTKPEKDGFWSYIDGRPMGTSSKDLLQFHDSFGYVFFSEDINTELTITPPFYHDTVFNRGVSGTLNCGRWVRFVGPTIIKQTDTPIKIKRGDPSMYIYFNQNVKLIQVKETTELQNLVTVCLSVKRSQTNTPLRNLYDMFLRSRYRKIILDEMRKNII